MSSLNPIVIDLDGSKPLGDHLIDPSDATRARPLGRRVRLYAKGSGETALVGYINWLRAGRPGRWLAFTGSGDFHHVTLSLLGTLPPDVDPFHLVLVDNHPDWFREKPTHHCGNWLSAALQLPGLRTVTLIGQNSPDVRWRRFYRSPTNDLASGRITLHPHRIARVRVPMLWPREPMDGAARLRPWGTEYTFRTIEKNGAEAIFRETAERLAGQRVYVSIDKDVLRDADSAPDWEQGEMTLNELTSGVRMLDSKCIIVGADVCGDRAPKPLAGLWKRLDAGRFFSKGPAWSEAAAALNRRANLAILDAFGVSIPGPPGVAMPAMLAPSLGGSPR